MTVENTVGIIISTFGSDEWMLRGMDLALETVQSGPVIHSHADTLHQARNGGADMMIQEHDPEWLVFLDADDSLASGYVEGILAGTGDLRQPMTVGLIIDEWDGEPNLIPAADSLMVRNWLVIGTGVRAAMFQEVGGFRDLPALEDWDLWLRCWKAGAVIGTAPEAIYEIGIKENSRNSPTGDHGRAYEMIRRDHGLA